MKSTVEASLWCARQTVFPFFLFLGKEEVLIKQGRCLRHGGREKWKGSVFPLVVGASLPEVMSHCLKAPPHLQAYKMPRGPLDMAKVTCAYKQ